MNKELEERLSKLEAEIDEIEKRNKRVELDKAWETSTARKIIIAGLTYLTIVIVMISFKVADPWINAILATIGFFLSSSTLPIFKSMWLERQNNSRKITV